MRLLFCPLHHCSIVLRSAGVTAAVLHFWEMRENFFRELHLVKLESIVKCRINERDGQFISYYQVYIFNLKHCSEVNTTEETVTGTRSRELKVLTQVMCHVL